MFRSALNGTYKMARRIVVAVVGFSVVLIGVIMIVTPGPAIVVIPAGLAILGAEFAFARRWLKQLKEKSKDAVNGLRGQNSRRTPMSQDERDVGMRGGSTASRADTKADDGSTDPDNQSEQVSPGHSARDETAQRPVN